MANEADLGNMAADIFLKAALENAKAESTRDPKHITGFCLNDCGERTHGAFCSADCRNDYNKRMRMKG